MSGYLYREVEPDDLDGVVRLAAHLDSLNLPADAEAIAAMIDASVSSFGRNDPDDRSGRFLFVLERSSDGALLGTSMIVASHGTTEDPHHAFRIDIEERYSESLGELFAHQTLTLVQSYRPHTELGALVLHPDFRGHPDRLGQGLSFVRFLYMALQPGRFHDRVEAELLPPLEADGSSLLWEWLGRPFTRLSYRDADRLSRGNREFIRSLFPRTPIHTALAPADVQAVIGAVGAQTRGVARMLTAAGFRFNHHIDPFDGGPHFDAKRADILPLQQARTLPFAGLTAATDAPKRLITRVGGGPFRAALGSWHEMSNGALVNADTAALLNLQAGDLLLSLPLTSPRNPEAPR